MAKGGVEQQQQPAGGGGDHSLDFLWVIAGIIIALMLIWHYEKKYIIQAICFVRFYEIEFIKLAIGYWLKLAPFAEQYHLILPKPNFAMLDNWQYFTAGNYQGADFSTIMALSAYVGGFLRYPIVVLLIAAMIYLYFSSAAQRFKNTFDMKLLRHLEQENWPQIAPIIKIDLVNTDLDTEPWAVALSPMKFCKKYKLLQEEKDNQGRPTVTLLRGAAYRLLSLQLGPRWKGPKYLPKYLQALFAVFTARINGDKKSADALIEQLAYSAAQGRIDYTGVRSLMVKNFNSKEVMKITSIHAYVTCVMASLLSASREAGVLATSEFLWLKPVDRRMWYMLNSVGRPTAIAEIAGAFAHWLAEKKLGIPLTIPMVDEAVNGLDTALKEIKYKPEE